MTEAEGPRVEPVRVVLVDDHSMFRSGVRAELPPTTGWRSSARPAASARRSR